MTMRRPVRQANKKGSAIPKSAGRALDVLETLSNSSQGLTFTEIRSELNIPKSSLVALLRLLMVRGYIETRDGRRYQCGMKMMRLTGLPHWEKDLVETAEDTMQMVFELTHETVNLATLDGSDVVFLHKKVPSSHLRYDTPVGMRMPAHVTSVGKAMLSAMSDEEIRSLYPNKELSRSTLESIEDREELIEEFREVRRAGCASDHEEGILGVCAVASPITDANGHAVAGLSIALPKARNTEEIERKHRQLVKAAARIISAKLGFLPREPIPTLERLAELWASG